jgi:hypothetical protein
LSQASGRSSTPVNRIREPGAPISRDKESSIFSGYNTPESAFESALWAGTHGDSNAFVASLAPEAELQTNDFEGFNAYRILGKEIISEDELLLDMEFETALNVKLKMKNIGGEGKLAGPEK